MDPACTPKRSELTQSEFLATVWDIEDRLEALSDPAELESIIEDIRQVGEEQTEKRDNMPEGLQDAPTGELLEQRADMCEDWANNLEQEDPPDEDSLDEDETLDDKVTEWLDEVKQYTYEGE
jgi:hypothetical protein